MIRHQSLLPFNKKELVAIGFSVRVWKDSSWVEVLRCSEFELDEKIKKLVDQGKKTSFVPLY